MHRLTLLASAFVALIGCDYSGDFLFAGQVPGVPGVVDLGEVVAASPSDATVAVQYAEVGPAPVGSIGGATLRFQGTGGPVCVWVDPEAVTWNTTVGSAGDGGYAYPDNVFDDGDVDIEVGQSIFYTGVVGETVGDFEVTYLDEIGNDIRLALNECEITDIFDELGSHAGRASAEYCTVPNTVPNLEYTVAISTWTTPLDDDILSFGVIVVDAACDTLKRQRGADSTTEEECVIRDEARSEGVVRPGFAEFEQNFCYMDFSPDEDPPEVPIWADMNYDDARSMYDFCLFESQLVDCKIEACYCGDPTDLPEPI